MSYTARTCATAPTSPRLGVMLGSSFSCGLAILVAVPGGLLNGLGATIARGGAHRRRTKFRRTPNCQHACHCGLLESRSVCWRVPVSLRWSARSRFRTPVFQTKSALSEPGAAPSGPGGARAGDAPGHVAVTRAATDRRSRARCPECGVIESMRRIERSGDGVRQDAVDIGAPRVVSDASAGAIAADATSGKGYEFTVRFRDGSTAVFSDANPRAWRLGSRVVVLGRRMPSNNRFRRGPAAQLVAP